MIVADNTAPVLTVAIGRLSGRRLDLVDRRSTPHT
jgi:hypothetical protein